MSSLMERIAAGIRRRRWFVLAAWVVLVLVCVPFAAQQEEKLVGGGFGVPGSQSEQVRDALSRNFDSREQLALVLVPQKDASRRSRVRSTTRALRAVREVPQARIVARARARAREATASGQTAVVPVEVLASQQREVDVARDIRDELEGTGGAVTASVIGRGALDAAIQDEAQEQLVKAEAIGFPIVLVILLVIFGSLTAAALPLLLGVAAVTITGGAIYLISQEFLVSVFATNTATMFGIALAVDYSMFILVRFREEVAAGRDRDAAIAKALSTSGVAIIYSGLTVIVAIGGLFLFDNAGLRSLGALAMLTVAISVLLSTLLLPVLIRLFGDRVVRRRRLPLLSRRTAEEGEAFWERWTRVVLGRPILFGAAALGTLLVLAIPTLSLDPGEDLLRQLPADNETRVGYERAAAEQGPGAASPVQVLLRSSDRGERVDRETVAAARRAVADDPQVAGVSPPRRAEEGRLVLLTAMPRADGSEEVTEDLVRRLRTDLAAGPASRGVDTQVGGVTAYSIDFQDQVFGGLWKVAVFGLAVSFLLLTVMLRSLVLPLKAVILNVLTIAAAYGVVVAVFQWGWLDGFLGFESKGSVEVFTMPLIITTVFGLSMDYEIFLLSRIRERYERTGDPDTAIAEGLASSARPISGAALIMVAVFAVFASTSLTSVKELGLALAVAIAIDATIVRLVLVPATMRMFGRWNWWLPRLSALRGLAKEPAK
jgi:RND superfamily putative drug exporter